MATIFDKILGRIRQQDDGGGGGGGGSYIPLSYKGADDGVAELDSSGYVPESQLRGYVANPLSGSSAPTTATAGKLGQLYVVTSSLEIYKCIAIDESGSTPSYTWRLEVNVAEYLPLSGSSAPTTATPGKLGQIYVETTTPAAYMCIAIDSSGSTPSYTWRLVPNGASYLPLTGGTLTGGINLSAGGYQQSITVITASDDDVELTDGGVYSHVPEAATTYTLPAVSDTTKTHEIILNVRFSAATISIAFEDSSSTTIVPLSTPTISAGSVVSYLCRFEPLLEQWAIMPVELGTYTEPEEEEEEP